MRGYVALVILMLGLLRELPALAADMAWVPAGAFTMGRDDGPQDERPAHRVFVAGFWIDQNLATNAALAEFLNAVGTQNARGERLFDDDDNDARIHRQGAQWRADHGFETHPVVEATWAGARDYCAWCGKRLPTEPEWEKAARGDDGRRYPWGDAAPDASRAHYGARWGETAPVGRRPASTSPYGALDMAGNAWQWVVSLYRPYPYRADDGREDPASTETRSTRGGGYDWPSEAMTTTQRGRTLSRAPRAGHHNIGLRCAR